MDERNALRVQLRDAAQHIKHIQALRKREIKSAKDQFAVESLQQQLAFTQRSARGVILDIIMMLHALFFFARVNLTML